MEEIKPNRAREMLREHYDMAQLSKTLATIEVNAPIDYDIKKAKIENLYTQDAYLMCKRLEFKNLLKRFEVDAPTCNAEEYFREVSELSEVQNLFDEAKCAAGVGLQCVAEDRKLLGVSLAVNPEKIAFVPVAGFVTEDYLIQQMTELVQSNAGVSVFDLKTQLFWIEADSDSGIFDAKIAAYLLNPLKNEYAYEDIAKDYLSLMIPSRADLLGKESLSAAMEEHAEAFLKVVCYQAYINLMAREPLSKQLATQGMKRLFDEIEMPLVYTLFDMERAGIVVDAQELHEYGENLSVSIDRIEQEIYEEAGEEFNINSPKQLGVILFEKLEMPNGKKTKTGYSTAADVLEKLAPEYPIVSKILEYRQLTKLKSTYADGLAAYIEEDGRIRSTFQQTITATGRLSSTEPNLQNIPVRMELGRLIRKVFLPADGCVLLDADYSQIELRLLAHMSGDENLIDAYKQAQDIHAITASKVFHVPFEEVTPLLRRNAKAVNFGIVYGISSFGLSQDLSITRKEAEGYIKSYFETYPGIKEFLDRLVEDGKKNGYVTTLYGRRRPVPEFASSNFMQRSFGERVAMNAPIQGTAADIIKIAMIHVHDRLKKEGLKSRLILQVHDELLVETHLEEQEQVERILAEEMKQAADLAVTLEIDMHAGTNWYEAK